MSDWDDYARTWDEGAPVIYADAAAESLRTRLTEHGVALSGARVLDFGCGTGLLATRLAPDVHHITALDPSAGMIARLKEKIAAGTNHIKNIDAVEGTLDALEHDAPRFDLITASSVCAFVDDYEGTLARLAASLAPGGVFCQWDWEYNPSDDEPFGLTRDAITRGLESAGLEILYVGTAFEAGFEGMVMRPLMGMGRRR